MQKTETMIRLCSTDEIDGEIYTTTDFEMLHPVAKLDLISDFLGVILELQHQCMRECYMFSYTYEPHALCAAAIHRAGGQHAKD